MASDTDIHAGGAFDYQAFLDRTPGVGAVADYSANQIVYAQGDPTDALYYIVTGGVRVSVVSEQGKEGIIALLGPGSFFGEGCLDGRPMRTSTVTTTGACKIVRLRPDHVMRSLTDDPEFSKVFFRFLLGRTEKLKADLIDQLFNSSEKRLARILLTLANAGMDAKTNVIAFPVNQELLANMVGTTRSRINRFMNKFRKLGYIDYGDEIRVHNSLINIILDEASHDS